MPGTYAFSDKTCPVAATHIYRIVAAVLEGARNTYWRMTVRENLAFFAGLQGINPKSRRAFHDELIERFGLTDKANIAVNELSTGMKQKVAVASAFAPGDTYFVSR